MSEETVSAEATETAEASADAASGTVLTEAAATTEADDKIANEETTEAKAEDEGSKDEAADEKAKTEDAQGGIDVEAFKMPEGFELDAELAGKAKPLFDELGLNQDQAQKLVDFFAEQRMSEVEGSVAQLAETQKGWVEAIKSEWGGDFDANVKVAAKAVALGGDELREALEMTGAGNHPAVIQFFHQVGQSISEDGLVAGDAIASQKTPLEKKLYPSMKG